MWQDVPVQLVDLPPIAPEFFEPWVPSVIRSADAALLVADLASDDVADATLAVLERLAEAHTELVGELPYDVEDERIRHFKTVMVANQARRRGARDRLEIVREWFGPRFPIVPVSARPAKDWKPCGRPHTIYWECCGSTRKSLASRPIGRGRSRCPSAAPSWIWPGRFIGISSIR